MTLKEHGTFTLEIRQEILLINPIGAWNLEMAQHFCADYREFCRELIEQPWGSLLDFGQWQLGPPDMWQPIEELAVWLSHRHHSFEAVICPLSIQKQLIKRRFEITPGLITEFFDDWDKAFAWCLQQTQQLRAST
ncbi:hypothetical protein [Dongshaea marina]|uniref:hypothetical protein n=1 Tax=Dongshaea marina TaxID=2047966 RepID=UPI000D3E6954|nr:hypothetical protein [Dongshaea marina]